jgi:hypothetical protein
MTTTTVINRTERANSFEFGKAGQRHKVYYDTLAQLTSAIATALAGERYLDTMRDSVDMATLEKDATHHGQDHHNHRQDDDPDGYVTPQLEEI